METITIQRSYREWLETVEKRFLEIYCITISDTGLGEEFFIDHWQSNEAPAEFVEWFGSKHDLTSAWEVGLRNGR